MSPQSAAGVYGDLRGRGDGGYSWDDEFGDALRARGVAHWVEIGLRGHCRPGKIFGVPSQRPKSDASDRQPVCTGNCQAFYARSSDSLFPSSLMRRGGGDRKRYRAYAADLVNSNPGVVFAATSRWTDILWPGLSKTVSASSYIRGLHPQR